VEKQFRKLENRLEADYATLRAENKELVEWQQQDEWTIHGLMTRMEMMVLNSETSEAYGLTQTGVTFTADTQ